MTHRHAIIDLTDPGRRGHDEHDWIVTLLRILCVGLLSLSLLGIATGCKQKASPKHPNKPLWAQNLPRPQPAADIPLELRHRNPDGSCVHISFSYALANQSGPNGLPLYNLAAWWHKKYHGGESCYGLRQKMDAAGIRYADTTSKSDVRFIDWACSTGRGCIVNDAPGHVRFLAGIDPAGTPGAKAYVLDNNHDRAKLWVYDRDDWLNNHWRGWAATPLYDPEPALTRP